MWVLWVGLCVMVAKLIFVGWLVGLWVEVGRSRDHSRQTFSRNTPHSYQFCAEAANLHTL